MKVLRSTVFIPGRSPITTIVRDRDVIYPLEEVVRLFRAQSPETFVIEDIFDMPDGDDQTAFAEGRRRAENRKRREEDMATLFYFTASSIIREKQKRAVQGIDTPFGITMNAGAPLSTEEIRETLELLAQHPAYTPEVEVRTFSRETGDDVVLQGGVVTVFSAGSRPPGSKGRVGPS